MTAVDLKRTPRLTSGRFGLIFRRTSAGWSSIRGSELVEAIKVIRQSDNDGFTPVIDPKFVVLGMINEYLGRRAIEGDGTVERFFVNERPIAGIFARYLASFCQDVGADPADISVVDSDTGHSHVDSKVMNERVNSLYRFEFPADQYLTTLDGHKRRVASVALGIEDFPRKRSVLYEPTEMNPRFSYMYGVFLRFGRGGLVVEMANASKKIELIKRVLEDLDVEWVQHRYSIGGAPVIHQISFGSD